MADPSDTPGYLAPLRQAITQPLLFGGAPRSWAILNATLALVIVFAGALLAGGVLAVLGHAVGVVIARRDPQAMDVLRRAMRIPDRLEP